MANLYNKAGLINIPVGYSDGFLYNIKPTDNTLGFKFDRASAATRVNEKGLIEDVGYFGPELVQNGNFSEIGSELVTNGDFETDSDWQKGTGWSISNGKAVSDGVSSNSNFTQNNILTLNKAYKISVNVVLNSGLLNVYATSSPTKSITSSGLYTFYGVCDRTDLDLHFKSVNFDGSIDNVSVKEVGQNWTVADDDVNNYVEFNQEEGTVRLKFLNTSPITTLTSDTRYLSGKKYKLTVDVKEVVSGAIKIDAAGVSQTYNSVGVQEAIIEPIGNSNISFYRATADVDITLNSVSLIEVLGDKPRIDYSDSLTEPSLLLEPQRTNSAVNSEFLDGISAPLIIQGSGFSILNNSENSPEGLTNAMKWTESTNNGTHWGGLSLTGALVGQPVSVSIFAKRGTSNDRDLVINIYDGSTSDRVHFNLSNGTIYNDGTTNLAITSMVDYGNGWYRCIYARSILSTGFNSVMGISNNNTESYLGNGTSNIFAYGLQIELNANYATSYIPTAGSTATRLGETANNAGDVNVFNSEEGVLYAEIAALVDDQSYRYITLSDGTNSNYVIIRYYNIANKISAFIENTLGVQGSTSHSFSPSETITNFHKVAFKWKANDFALWIDGTEVSTQSSGTTFSSNVLNKLQFNEGDGSGNDFYGKVRNLQVFNKALTDRELEILTIQ